MIPYGRQFIDEEDIQAVEAVLRSDWLTQGPEVSAFEKAVASYCSVKYAVAASSGTAALHLAYLAAGLRAGDEVITTPNSFAATANMLLAVGAKPVFGDIRLDTYNLAEDKIEALITDKTKAIVPVDFAGQPCAWDEIAAIAQKHNLLVIEDACHALGAGYKKRKIGAAGAAMTVFSFHPVKPITTGEGGLVTTDSEEYFKKMILLRSHGMTKDEQGRNVMTALGYNYRLTDLGAALGRSQLKKLDRFIEQRRQVVVWYQAALAGLAASGEIILPAEAAGNHSSWHLYVIRVKDGARRDELAAYLKARNIGVNWHYPAIYAHPYYREYGYENLSLPHEEIYQKSCLTLPCYPTLTREQVEFVSQAIKKFFAAASAA